MDPLRPSRDGILVGIVTCNQEKYAWRRRVFSGAWIPAIRKAGYDVEFFDGERLGISDDYLSLPSKTKSLCKWAIRNGYDRLVKCDDDTYIHAGHFKPVYEDYAGLVAPANDYGWPQMGIPNWSDGTFPYDYASGGCYWMSRKSMAIVADAPFTEDFAEDRWVGDVLRRAGIELKGLPDYYSCTTAMPSDGDFTVLTQVPTEEVLRKYHHEDC